MQKDTTQKQLEAYNDVVADIYNVAEFGGKQVLREEALSSLPTESFTRNTDGTLRQGFRDVRKADKRKGEYHLILGLENQTGVDNTMPERVMGYEYASYEEQIKERMAKNKAEKKPAVIARLHEDQKLAPVITTVVNWSGEEWRGPRSLHDMLEFPPEKAEEIRPLVADYPIHLLEMSTLPEEVQNRFQSDFRILAEYAACRSEPEKWKGFMKNYDGTIVHPEELLDALSAVASDSRYKEIKERLVQNENGEKKEGGLKMCVVAEDLENIGIQKGIQKGIKEGASQELRKGIRNMLRNGLPEEMVFAVTECSREFLNEVRKEL